MKNLKLGKRVLAAILSAATVVTGISGVANVSTANRVALPVFAASDDTTNYAKLLQYSMYLYDANMCGASVGSASALTWRDACHTGDEVSGGFHDAGDHAKFGLPAGFSASTLGWGYYEFKDTYDALGQTAHLKKITDYFADFFKKSTVLSGDTVSKFCYQVGDGAADHNYWGPPETQEAIKGSRESLWTTNGASDIAAEYAAALAVNYLNFGNEEDLTYAKALYKFSKQYNQKSNVNEYGSEDYEDDQAWAAGFLYLATNDASYKSDMDSYFSSGNRVWGEVYYSHCWNNVSLGAAVLYGEIGGGWKWAESYLNKNCSDTSNFLAINSWGSARLNTGVQLPALVASKRTSNDYTAWCKAQMSMILGKNSASKNLVVGFNENSPKYPHHRAASGHAFTTKDEATPTWDATNSHVLVGALVGGPSSSDFSTYNDSVSDYNSNEVAIDYNAALVGAAAALYDVYGTGSLESSIPGVGSTDPIVTTATTVATTNTTEGTTLTTAPTTTAAPATTASSGGNSTAGYTTNLNQKVTYSELPADDKMIGWNWSDL